jgi:hypothetical protein
MPNAWELGPSNYTVDDVEVQFRIREVLVLPEYKGKTNVIQKVRFSIYSKLEDFQWEQHNYVWLDIHDVDQADNFISVDEVTEQQVKDWVIAKHLGTDGLLNVRRSHLQVFNENYKDKISQKLSADFINDSDIIEPDVFHDHRLPPPVVIPPVIEDQNTVNSSDQPNQ